MKEYLRNKIIYINIQEITGYTTFILHAY
jgi:hypothetical protein